jgi:CopG family nickel-responsive transcriptional regulator
MEDNKVVRFGVSIKKKLFDAFEEFMRKKGYAKRSKAIRDLMRNAILEEAWKDKEGIITATVVIVYNHKMPLLTDKIVDIQHNYLKEVLFSSHVHINEINCMEITVLRGEVKRIYSFSKEFSKLRGVKFVKIVPAATGKDVI